MSGPVKDTEDHCFRNRVGESRFYDRNQSADQVCGAASGVSGRKCEAVNVVREVLHKTGHGSEGAETLSDADARLERLMLGLRTREGTSLADVGDAAALARFAGGGFV
ncbi:MAG TPA: hypothetical protein PLD82_02480, partial [Spirochaetota bacterium]|nr:hypothetical protein [Spirochaetota bacterium]